MPDFQLLGAHIVLDNDQQQVVVRHKFNPITYPEVLVLRVIHGSEAAVHSLVDVGTVDRSFADERERLSALYGKKVIDGMFPPGAMSLPLADKSAPTQDEIEAAVNAASKAAEKVRARKAKAQANEPQPSTDQDAPLPDTPAPNATLPDMQLPDLTK